MSIYRNLQKAMRINSQVKQDTVHNNLQGQQMWNSFKRTQMEDAAWRSQAYPNRRVPHEVCHKNRRCQMHCHLQKSEYVYRVFGKKYGLECTRGRAHILIPAYKGPRCSITAAFVDKKPCISFSHSCSLDLGRSKNNLIGGNKVKRKITQQWFPFSLQITELGLRWG